MVNLHNDCCHIIAAKSLACSDVCSAAIVQQKGHCTFHFTLGARSAKIALVQFLSHKVDSLLIGLDVPDAVAGEKDKLRGGVDLFDTHLREAGDHLLLLT